MSTEAERARERAIGRQEERIRTLSYLRRLMPQVETIAEANLLKQIAEELTRRERLS